MIGIKIFEQKNGPFIARIGRSDKKYLFPIFSDEVLDTVVEYSKDLADYLEIEYVGVKYNK